MTSSPGPAPAASRARCSAVVQLETAHAYGAPTREANSDSNAATSGPCVTQPARIGLPAASASARPMNGLVMGMIESGMDSVSTLFLFRAPPAHQAVQTLF